MARRRNKGYWLLHVTEMCPVCGHEVSYDERAFSKKPKDPAKRYEVRQEYDQCLEREELAYC